MSTSWAPIAMLFLSPVLISALKSRSSGSLLRLFSADLIAIAIALGIHASKPNGSQWIGIMYMAALAALILTGSLLGAVLRFGIDGLYSRFVARRAST